MFPVVPNNSGGPTYKSERSFNSTRALIFTSNYLGLAISIAHVAIAIYIIVACFAETQNEKLFTGSVCSKFQKIGGPISLVLGIIGILISLLFLLVGRQW